MKAYIKDYLKTWAVLQTKYAWATPKNLGLGLNFRPYSEGYFLSPWCAEDKSLDSKH